MTREPECSEIEVDSSPINCAAPSWRDSQMHGDEHRLVIEPNRGYFRVAWGFLAFGGLGVPLMLLADLQEAARRGGGLVILGGVALAVGAALIALQRRFVFDRGAGTLWMRPGSRAAAWPSPRFWRFRLSTGERIVGRSVLGGDPTN